MAYFCYLLECADGTFYCGWTKDLQHRVEMHNKGRGARYTRSRGPVSLVYFEELDNQGDAMRRELELKKKNHQQKADLIRQFKAGDDDG
jgi:putative endonuclease